MSKTYYIMNEFSLHKLENIEDKKIIHQYENKNIIIDLENIKDKHIINELR